MMKLLFTLFLFISIFVGLNESVKIFAFTGPSCDSSSTFQKIELSSKNPWANLCTGGTVQSVMIPTNTTIAFYKQCRSNSGISNINPNYERMISSENDKPSCVTFHSSPLSISMQLVSNMTQVCGEYGAHMIEFCKKGSLCGDCAQAVDAAESIKHICKDTPVLVSSSSTNEFNSTNNQTTMPFCKLTSMYANKYEDQCLASRAPWIVLSLVLVVVILMSFVVCCFARGRKSKPTVNAYAVQSDIGEPSRIVIATVVPATIVHQPETVQPQVVYSRTVSKKSQVDSDREYALRLSQE